MAYQTIALTVADRVATVTLNRPDKLNALTVEMIEELGLVVDEIRDRTDIGGLILTGAGRAFVAGADITELARTGGIEAKALSRRGQLVFNRIEALPKPVLAAVNGFALGGGCGLGIAWHLPIASGRAKFGQPAVQPGRLPAYRCPARPPP